MSMADIDRFLDRVTKGELVVDNTHPRYRELESALDRYRLVTIVSVVPSSGDIRNTLNAIGMAAAILFLICMLET